MLKCIREDGPFLSPCFFSFTPVMVVNMTFYPGLMSARGPSNGVDRKETQVQRVPSKCF